MISPFRINSKFFHIKKCGDWSNPTPKNSAFGAGLGGAGLGGLGANEGGDGY